MNGWKFLSILGVEIAVGPVLKAQVAEDCKQLVVSVAAGWKSDRAVLRCYEREGPDFPWRPVVFGEGIPVLLGANGLAWGVGEFRVNVTKQAYKRERDQRAPAGIFAIGRVFGYDAEPPAGTTLPYHQVTKWTAWSDDPENPMYNQLVEVDPAHGIPPWFEKARLRLGDFAYKWKVEIRHNSHPPQPGMGSAIFFHIRRGKNVPTHGCTTMEEANLLRLITWLQPAGAARYVLLPQADYDRVREVWKLP